MVVTILWLLQKVLQAQDCSTPPLWPPARSCALVHHGHFTIGSIHRSWVRYPAASATHMRVFLLRSWAADRCNTLRVDVWQAALLVSMTPQGMVARLGSPGIPEHLASAKLSNRLHLEHPVRNVRRSFHVCRGLSPRRLWPWVCVGDEVGDRPLLSGTAALAPAQRERWRVDRLALWKLPRPTVTAELPHPPPCSLAPPLAIDSRCDSCRCFSDHSLRAATCMSTHCC
jgi:hypothetical protein